MLKQPVKAWAEVRPSSPNGIEVNLLTGLIGFHFVYFSVEVQDMNALRPLAFDDRANLSLKKAQQTGID